MEKNNMNVCEVTVKFHLKDGNAETRTFTDFGGDWTKVHEMTRDYTAKHFKDVLSHTEHLNHASYEIKDLDTWM
jgi:hypothetical protein